MKRLRLLVIPICVAGVAVGLAIPKAEATPCTNIIEFEDREFILMDFSAAVPTTQTGTGAPVPMTQEVAGWKDEFTQPVDVVFGSPGTFEGNELGSLTTIAGLPPSPPEAP